ncbi:MAG TPA: hypothetical protein DEQ87_11725 [Algoriphagus sp.]|jgi:lysophospholipase L1-like esterase|nr:MULTISPECIES: hypothetical protein [unclassified Algoriphagus]MAL12057.1 hypothetical protein [Algoriphagus sp.]MAN87322.1 hypothetical protein [Algoriphagus sp.]QYH38529.1 hypothetical protein GYM62_06855 [Algoriphagus sp. NBT04N3]HAD50450.1 hypothetical protein [Algoriphagus sp.]HAS59179.1 hypothetical protein [Algoriphagus sp.]|tara:strand:- start:279 stop:1742 length:1464 start_codon:yes stop_codon:yes gene_type:complete
MKYINKSIFLLVFGALAACTYDFPEPQLNEPTAGSADFSKIISVGNSLTAGYMDGALYNRGQANSFAVIFAEQAKTVGGGEFNVPSINSENGFFQMGPQGPLGRLILRVNPQTGAASPAPIGQGDLPSNFTGNKSNLNNFGVPGITLLTALIPQTGGPASPQNPAYNRLYERFASNPGTSTVIGDASAALANGGTFFTFWLGSNDVLGYATGGASNPAILTSNSDFQQRLSAALGALLQANPQAKGAVANVPSLAVLPYFTLVPWNALPLSQAQADQANAGYAQYNGGLAVAKNAGLITAEEEQLRRVQFKAGQNAFVMSDESLTNLSALGLPSLRMSKSSDRATLPLAQVLGQSVGGNPALLRGISFPVEDQYVLTPQEQAEINQKITAFNSIITAAVQGNNERLVLVDVNDLLNKVLQGQVSSGGVALTASVVPPSGGFSLDGVHPNARAHAFVANHFIEAINAKWGSNIPKANPNNFIGNDLPR